MTLGNEYDPPVAIDDRETLIERFLARVNDNYHFLRLGPGYVAPEVLIEQPAVSEHASVKTEDDNHPWMYF